MTNTERGNARYAARMAKIAARLERSNAIARGEIKVRGTYYDWNAK